jgi:hypothetical protein
VLDESEDYLDIYPSHPQGLFTQDISHPVERSSRRAIICCKHFCGQDPDSGQIVNLLLGRRPTIFLVDIHIHSNLARGHSVESSDEIELL